MQKTRMRPAAGLGGALAALMCLIGHPAEAQAPGQTYSPPIAAASNEGHLAIQRIRVPKGLEVKLFAAEPMLANPVSFCIDEQGRFYVAETFRIQAGVTDTRDHMYWLDDDLASRTVADRVAMYRKHLGEKVASYAVAHDRVRLIEDRDGDGKADHATVFADGFNQIPTGIGAGLLARQGNVWYTCIPDLWLLRDTQGIGRADFRKSLHHGYGVHVNFYGHDLHGLRFGPDGKLYFSIGDRGLNVETEGRTLAYPDTGAVLRCNPDGSELEVFAFGLRNPQELAFDQYGNLFTGDNNSDSGDLARWVYVVEGGDSGWRIGYQYMEAPISRGPWNAEKLWHPQCPGQAAYIVPPIANVADGPSGLTYYPGTGLPERYQGHFFLCDFRGSSGSSGVRSLAVQPKGASFEMVDQHQFAWGVLATDVDFGPDGGLYITDWVEGWTGPNKGRIYKIFDPSMAKDPLVLDVKKLLGEGMAHRSLQELAKLLEHADMRVRQEAQFALAERGSESIPALGRVARSSGHELARLHAIWALGQIGRKRSEATQPLVTLLADGDAEVRAQAAKVLGDDRAAAAYEKLLPLLRDSSPRVRFFATMSLGKLGRTDAVRPILQMLEENGDEDPYLRHAGVMALAWIGDVQALLSIDNAPAAARMGVLLALRRLGRPELARFLNDPEPSLALEAARAIYDLPINEAMPRLAALAGQSDLPEMLLYRVLAANFRLGQAEHAATVAAAAALDETPEWLRIEALTELGDWARPSGRDRVMGLWRPIEPRPAHVAADALWPLLSEILRNAPENVEQAAARTAGKLAIQEAGPTLFELVEDKERAPQVRTEAIKSLEALEDNSLDRAVQLAVADPDAKLRTEGYRLLAKRDPQAAIPMLEAALEHGSAAEQQGALSILGQMQEPAVDTVLSRWLAKLIAGEVPLEIQLDVLQASSQRPAEDIAQKIHEYEAAKPKEDLMAQYREALAGGDAQRGRKIFYEKAEVSCLRCHKIQGVGGEVGPDLTGIATRQNREYLLESLIDPNKQIAKGFDTLVLALTSGQVVTGVLKEDDGTELHLITPEGNPLTVQKAEIDEQSRGPSAMPEDVIKHLSKSELRDLVEFLAGLK